MLPEAYVQDGTLAPARQAFKAMIVRGNDTLTVPGVQRLADFAHQGLPIIFSGGLPQNLTGYNVSGTEYVRSTLAGLVCLKNVHIVPYENLAASLNTLGIQPRTRVDTDRIWYTYWRDDADASASYVFVYNDAWDSEIGEGASSGAVTFETTGVPYMHDAWTGAVSPILGYQRTKCTTTIPLSLAGNQSMIIAFHHDATTSTGTRLLSLPSTVFSAEQSGGNGSNLITVKAARSTETVLLSNGATMSLPIPAPVMNLKDWTLVIESWTSPSDPGADQTVAAKSNSTHQISGKLKPWNQIDDSLADVSGRGFYTTTFSWPPSHGKADGAMLDLGAYVNTARVWVNGHRLPPLDCTAARTDIDEFLVDGDNALEVVVTTTLGNALRPIYENVKSSGTLWLGPEPIAQDYGLVMPVSVVPYRTTTVRL